MDVNVFEFDDPLEFLNATLATKKERNRNFSLRAWAKQLGYANPSLLSAVLRGERKLKADLAARVMTALGANDEELKYFEMIVLVRGARTEKERESYLRILASIRPEKKFHNLELEKFRFISEWYHLAVLEMVELRDFVPNPAWISRRLRQAISPSAAQWVLERLVRLKVLTRDSKGRLSKTRKVLEVQSSTPNEAVRTHHLQMIDRARAAAAEEPIEARHIAGSTLAIPATQWPKVVELIEDFHRRLSRLGAQGNGDHVIRVNTQAFKLTSEMGASEGHVG